MLNEFQFMYLPNRITTTIHFHYSVEYQYGIHRGAPYPCMLRPISSHSTVPVWYIGKQAEHPPPICSISRRRIETVGTEPTTYRPISCPEKWAQQPLKTAREAFIPHVPVLKSSTLRVQYRTLSHLGSVIATSIHSQTVSAEWVTHTNTQTTHRWSRTPLSFMA